MTRIGYTADKQNAVSICKTVNQCTAGFILSGFGTCPAPGAICDNAIERVLNFASHYLQKAFDVLFSVQAKTDKASTYLLHHMERINANIGSINLNIGQGVYLAGVVCYFNDSDYICLPFGGCSTYIWNQGQLSLMDGQVPNDRYIRDALGGGPKWSAPLLKGTLPDGAQLLCSTDPLCQALIAPAMESLASVEPQFVVDSVFQYLTSGELPITLMSFAQFPDLEKEETV